MKVELYSDGKLVVSASTEIEHWALYQWEKGYQENPSTAYLVIDLDNDRKGWASIKEFNETFKAMGERLQKFKDWEKSNNLDPTFSEEKK